jgi:hypothetical protein
MKKLFLLFIVILIGCGKDDPQPSYNFKDQTAAGEIEGVSWSFAEGTASDNGVELSIDLMLDQPDAPCDVFIPDGDEVFFSIPNAVGLYKLKFSFKSGAVNQTATLFDEEETLNVICSEGAIEILMITDTEVTGRLDIRSDKDNYINGNFTVALCP